LSLYRAVHPTQEKSDPSRSFLRARGAVRARVPSTFTATIRRGRQRRSAQTSARSRTRAVCRHRRAGPTPVVSHARRGSTRREAGSRLRRCRARLPARVTARARRRRRQLGSRGLGLAQRRWPSSARLAQLTRRRRISARQPWLGAPKLREAGSAPAAWLQLSSALAVADGPGVPGERRPFLLGRGGPPASRRRPSSQAPQECAIASAARRRPSLARSTAARRPDSRRASARGAGAARGAAPLREGFVSSRAAARAVGVRPPSARPRCGAWCATHALMDRGLHRDARATWCQRATRRVCPSVGGTRWAPRVAPAKRRRRRRASERARRGPTRGDAERRGGENALDATAR
jgi:hypothetical protein